MANKYYSSIGVSATTMTDIANALTDKYGTGVTILFKDSLNLIFTCAAISNKVIKINQYSVSGDTKYFFGDAWTSGSTITNPVQFGGSSGANTFTVTSYYLVLGDNFYFLCGLAGSSTYAGQLIIIGKMTNEKYICIGHTALYASNYSYNAKGRNTTDGTDIVISTFGNPFASSGNKLYKQNIIIVGTSGLVEQNADGSFATIAGIYNISHSLTNNTVLVGSNYLFSQSNMFMADSKSYLGTCLFVEF